MWHRQILSLSITVFMFSTYTAGALDFRGALRRGAQQVINNVFQDATSNSAAHSAPQQHTPQPQYTAEAQDSTPSVTTNYSKYVEGYSVAAAADSSEMIQDQERNVNELPLDNEVVRNQPIIATQIAKSVQVQVQPQAAKATQDKVSTQDTARVRVTLEWEKKLQKGELIAPPRLYTQGRYFTSHSSGSCFWNGDGGIAWEIPGVIKDMWYVTSERILLRDSNNNLKAFNPDGKVAWEIPGIEFVTPTSDSIVFTYTGNILQMHKADEKTGKVFWTNDLSTLFSPILLPISLIDHRKNILRVGWNNQDRAPRTIIAVIPHEGKTQYIQTPLSVSDHFSQLILGNDGVIYLWSQHGFDCRLFALDKKFNLLWERKMPYKPQVIDSKGYIYSIYSKRNSSKDKYPLHKYRPDGTLEKIILIPNNGQQYLSGLFINHNDEVCFFELSYRDAKLFVLRADDQIYEVPLGIDMRYWNDDWGSSEKYIPDISQDGTFIMKSSSREGDKVSKFTSNLFGFSQNAIWPTFSGDKLFPYQSRLITDTTEKNRMTWTEVPGAEYYHLILTNSAGTIVYENENLRELFMDLPGDLPTGLYSFKVRAGAGGEWGGWSLMQSTQKIPSLVVSTVSMDYNYSGDKEPRTFFHWYTETRLLPDKYEFKLIDQNGKLVFEKATDINNCYLDSPLKPGTYRMAARSGIQEQWSEWKETAFNILPKPENLMMADKYSGSPIFTWNAVKGARSYRFTVYSSETGKEYINETVDAPRRTGSFVLTPGEKYAWKIWAVDQYGISEPAMANIVLLGTPEADMKAAE